MKKRLELKIFIALVAIMTAPWAQVLWAEGPSCETLIDGAVHEIIDDENAIVLMVNEEETDTLMTVYGIPLNYLENWNIIALEEGFEVSINAHDCPFSGRLLACSLSVDAEELDLRPGRRSLSLTNTADAGPRAPAIGNNNCGGTTGPGLRIGVHENSGHKTGNPPRNAPNAGQNANGRGNDSGTGG